LAKAQAYTIVHNLLFSWDFMNLNIGLSKLEILLEKDSGKVELDTVIDNFGGACHLQKNKGWVLFSTIRLYF